MWDPLSIYPDDIDMRVFGFESIADADRHRVRSNIRFVQVDENVEDFDVDFFDYDDNDDDDDDVA